VKRANGITKKSSKRRTNRPYNVKKIRKRRKPAPCDARIPGARGKLNKTSRERSIATREGMSGIFCEVLRRLSGHLRTRSSLFRSRCRGPTSNVAGMRGARRRRNWAGPGAFEEVLGQRLHIVAALAQRRDVQESELQIRKKAWTGLSIGRSFRVGACAAVFPCSSVPDSRRPPP
jgi:hypothetical protein